MTQRSVKRTLERVMALGRDELVRLAGHGCESGEELVARLAFGLASPREMRRAQVHLTTCPRCCAMYERLDLWREKVAALLPVPAVAKAHPGLVDRVAHQLMDRLAAFKQNGADTARALREHAAHAGAQAKQHATATYYRAVDPTPLAGVRPGTAAAAVAGCLAIGGGTTYCVQQGVDPIGGLIGEKPPPRHFQQPHRRKHLDRSAQAAAPLTPVVQAPTATTPQQQSTPTTPVTTTQAQPPPAPQDEFDPTANASVATATRSHPTSSNTTRAAPAPAPTSGPGEFGGP